MFVLTRFFSSRHDRSRPGIHYAIAFSFFFGLLGCQRLATGTETSGSLARSAILRVATSGDYQPFSQWAQGEAEPSGFSVEIARAYALDQGVGLRWVRFRWPELNAELDADSFDIALSGITVRPDRSAKGRFSLPLTTSGAVVLVREDSALQKSRDLDQPMIRIAVNAGGHLERVAHRLFPTATIRPIDDNRSVLEELTRGRVDAVLTDSLEAPHWQRNTHLRLRAIGPLTRDRKAAWFPPKRTDEAERFNRWLLRIESDGQLARIRAHFELSPDRTASVLPALLSSLAERLTLMIAVADAKNVLGIATENLQREEVVLNAAGLGVLDSAEAAGIEAPDAAAIQRLFRTQIEAAKWIQDRRRRALPSTHGASQPVTREAAQAELDEVIRPALIYLGDRISMLLVASIQRTEQPLSSSIPLTFANVSKALAGHDLPDDHLRRIYEALAEVLQSTSAIQ